MIVKATFFGALLLLSELKCWILVCARPMRAEALPKLEEGYVKFRGNVFPALSQLFGVFFFVFFYQNKSTGIEMFFRNTFEWMVNF